MDYSNTLPIREFARRRHISPTKVYRWIDQGLIASFLDGQRRMIVVDSYDELVRRLVKEQAGVKLASSNPKTRTNRADVGESVSVTRTEHRGSRARTTT